MDTGLWGHQPSCVLGAGEPWPLSPCLGISLHDMFVLTAPSFCEDQTIHSLQWPRLLEGGFRFCNLEWTTGLSVPLGISPSAATGSCSLIFISVTPCACWWCNGDTIRSHTSPCWHFCSSLGQSIALFIHSRKPLSVIKL